MFSKFQISLNTKLIAGLVLTGAAVFVGSVFLSILLVNNFTEVMISRAKVINADFVYRQAKLHTSAGDYDRANPERADQVFSEFLEQVNTTEIVRIKVWGKNGTIVFSDQRQIIGKNFADNPNFIKSIHGARIVVIKPGPERENEFESGLGQLMEIYVPIDFPDTGNVGVIEVYASLAFVNAEIDAFNRSILYFNLLALLGILVVGGATYHFLRVNVIHPVATLQAASEKVAAGDFSASAALPSRDEIGKLGQSFDRMVKELHASHRKIVEDKDYLDNVLVSMNEALAVTTEDGRIINTNRALDEMLGYTHAELTGKNMETILAGGFQGALPGSHGATFNPTEQTYLAKDGTAIPVLVSVAQMQKKENDHSGFVFVAQDITERKKLEAQIQEAQRLEVVGALAGGIAHNFNNLLQVISGNATIVKFGLDPGSPGLENLASIDQCVEKGSTLTGQLLGFARRGKFVIRKIHLNETVAGMAAMVLETHPKIRIDFKDEDQQRLIDGDQPQIEQVLLNILINACQAMEDGGLLSIRIDDVNLDHSLAGSRGLTPGNYFKLSITDTGIGMAPETLEKIFDPFFSTKGVGIGSGLGLASSQGIVKNHKGMITATSQVGKGSTFEIHLPAAKPESAGIAKTGQMDLKGGETVLLVDDNPEVVLAVRSMLENLSLNVLVAHGGAEALEIFTKNSARIDLVILDLVMPEMDGEEVFAALKNIKKDVRVLLASGYSIEGQAAKIMERGCDAFIQKPFSAEKLFEAVRQVLRPN